MIKIENLHKRFGNSLVLDGINFEVPESETYVILGRSGTGKSVLLKCIVRLLEPEAGRIFIDNKNVLELSNHELNELRKEIGFLFQSAALYDSMTVRENLSFPLIRHTDLTTKEIEMKVKEMLRLVGLEDVIDKMPSELSGGMRKRIGLARALILRPKIMLYDEPTTGLDPVTSKEIAKLIIDMQKKFKMTNIVVTHDMTVALSTADKILLLEKGHFIFEGTPEELMNSKFDLAQKFLSNKLD